MEKGEIHLLVTPFSPNITWNQCSLIKEEIHSLITPLFQQKLRETNAQCGKTRILTSGFTTFLQKLREINAVWITQCGNCRNSFSHFFRKNFVKAMDLLKKLLNSWFDDFFFSDLRENLSFTVSTLCCHTSLTKISWK